MYEIPGAEHHLIDTDGVTLSVYTAGAHDGSRPAVVFSHGFPELAYSWRDQLTAVAAAGFFALAPDQRGYGGSSCPDEIEAYDIEHLTGDLVGILDHFGIDRAVFVGHDWGGLIVWQMPFLHRARTAGVVGVNTPFIPRLPLEPLSMFRHVFGDDHYIVRFQEPGVADAVFAAKVDTIFERMMRGGVSPEEIAAVATVTNFEEGLANPPDLGVSLLDPEAAAVYVGEFRRTGFTGGLNWYRNFDRNWHLTAGVPGDRIEDLPCLMITAEWDPFLPPAMAQGMHDTVADLEIHEIPRCGHWTQQEAGPALDHHLVDWLGRRF